MRFEIPIFDGVDELDALGPYEVLQIARKALQTVKHVTGSRGLSFIPDGTYSPGADVLILPGGNWIDRDQRGAWGEYQRGDLFPVIQAAADGGALLAAVCTGTMLLVGAGLIGNRRATTHRGAWEDLEAAGATLITDRVVDDGNLVTSGGITSGIDLALWLVERQFSEDLADEAARELEYSRFRPPANTC
jgi:transcriptional regulator GlxA family with amidase domain